MRRKKEKKKLMGIKYIDHQTEREENSDKHNPIIQYDIMNFQTWERKEGKASHLSR